MACHLTTFSSSLLQAGSLGFIYSNQVSYMCANVRSNYTRSLHAYWGDISHVYASRREAYPDWTSKPVTTVVLWSTSTVLVGSVMMSYNGSQHTYSLPPGNPAVPRWHHRNHPNNKDQNNQNCSINYSCFILARGKPATRWIAFSIAGWGRGMRLCSNHTHYP